MMRGSLKPLLRMFVDTPAFCQNIESVVLSSTLPAREYTVYEPLRIWTTWPGPTEAPMSGGVRVHGCEQEVPVNWLAISPASPPSARDGVAESIINRHDHCQTHDVDLWYMWFVPGYWHALRPCS